jgi:hypothetical protein
MKTYIECLPCIVNFSLNSIQLVIDNKELEEKIMRGLLSTLSKIDYKYSPPELSYIVISYIKKYLGDTDPYRESKKRFNKFCMHLLPNLRQKVANSKNPFETAIRMAIAGNIIDVAFNTSISERNVLETIEECMSANLYTKDNIKVLKEKIERAKGILILGDNAGEIVFDQLLIEQMPTGIVTYAVKSKPILNDATMEDAIETGLTEIAEVIETGSDMPGTVLEKCSPEFVKRFNDADIIIAKGQANYETLSEVGKQIFFILKVKCPIIARDIGYKAGNCVVHKNC